MRGFTVRSTCLAGVQLTFAAVLLVSVACDKSPDDAADAASKSGSGVKSAPTPKSSLGALDAELVGRWNRVDGKLYFHLAEDGQFSVGFDGKADTNEFPATLRGKATSYFGKWKSTKDELIFTDISCAGTPMRPEARMQLQRGEGMRSIKIDGVPYQKAQASGA